MVTIGNVRTGFACNSSSTHSILILGDDDPKPNSNPSDYDHYGWEAFTLVTDAEKMGYLASQLRQSMRKEFGTWASEKILRALFEGLNDVKGVDHQSLWGPLPYDYNPTMNRTYMYQYQGEPKEVSKDFIEDLVDFAKRDDVVFLGGNDNSDGHPLAKRWDDNSVSLADGINVALSDSYISMLARKDGDWWILFNPYNGAKTRFSFKKNPLPHSNRTPELVDLKITDFCPLGCSYCYQGSTVKGAHASKRNLDVVIESLAHMNVFEVAVGGGEPTLHPHFKVIVETIKKSGMTANVTTRNLDYVADNLEWFKKNVGAVAFSVDSVMEMERIRKLVGEAKGRYFYYDDADNKHLSYTFQVVENGMEQGMFVDMLKKAAELHVDVTLLGWKTVGRGHPWKKHDWDWLDTIFDNFKNEPNGWKKGVWFHGMPRLNVDTPIIKKDKFRIKERLGTSDQFFTELEGQYSMYIDAVEMTYGESSYIEPRYMKYITSVDNEKSEIVYGEDYVPYIAEQILKKFPFYE